MNGIQETLISEKVDQAIEILLSIPAATRPAEVEQSIGLLLSVLRCPTPTTTASRLKTMNICEPDRRPSSKLVQVEYGSTDEDKVLDPFQDPKKELEPIAKSMISRKVTVSQTLRKQVTLKRFNTSKKYFSAHDVDDSDGINPKEFKALVYSMGYFMTPQEAALTIASLDSNADGEISFSEFLKWWESDQRFVKLQMTQEQTQQLQEAVDYFTFFDKLENGYLTTEQFTEMYENLKSWGAFFGPQVTMEQLIKEIKGNNQSDNISFNDYIGWLTRKNAITPIQIN